MKQKTLFTPGPLNTPSTVKSAMQIDVGSRTPEMTELTQNIRTELTALLDNPGEFTAIPMQGSGTFALEAMISSFLGPQHRVLILANGAYGDRLTTICNIHNINYKALSFNSLEPIPITQVANQLKTEPSFTHLLLVHFETGEGVLNDINAILKLAEQHHCQVLLDAMSSFPVLPINTQSNSLAAITSSANKCLHGPPGFAFVLARKNNLLNTQPPKTLSLDLNAQYQSFEQTGQWRFTPPTHSLLGFHHALLQFKQQGGAHARLAHYQTLADLLITELKKTNIQPVIQKAHRAPIIITFQLPKTHQLTSQLLEKQLHANNLVIYPAKQSNVKQFRIGVIGELTKNNILSLTKKITAILNTVCDQQTTDS